jgi:hypothetical protein
MFAEVRFIGGIAMSETGEDRPLPLSTRHAALYGRLLQANEGIRQAGGSLMLYGMFAVIATCVVLHLGLLDSVLGSIAGSLRSLWLYGLALLGAFLLCGSLSTFLEGAAYRRFRLSIANAIPAAGLTVHEVMTAIENDPALKTVSFHLKRDPEFFD